MEKKNKTFELTRIAVLTAISCVLMILIRIPFPPAPFLVYDPADIPIYITAFAYGPAAGMLITVVVSFIQAFPFGGSGLYGFIMHVFATGLFVIVAGLMYKHKKTKKEAIISIIVGVIVMTVAMCVANYFITPLFMGTPKEAVVAMLVPVIIPFNLLKGGINGFITFIVYKRLSPILHFGKNK